MGTSASLLFCLCKTGEVVLHNGPAVEWHWDDVMDTPACLLFCFMQNRLGGLA